jgi:hypothetical protein
LNNNPLINSTSSISKHLINQNKLRKDILGLNTERKNVTPIKLIDNNRYIKKININEFNSERKNLNINSNINCINRDVFRDLKVNNLNAKRQIYIDSYKK